MFRAQKPPMVETNDGYQLGSTATKGHKKAAPFQPSLLQLLSKCIHHSVRTDAIQKKEKKRRSFLSVSDHPLTFPCWTTRSSLFSALLHYSLQQLSPAQSLLPFFFILGCLLALHRLTRAITTPTQKKVETSSSYIIESQRKTEDIYG